MARKSQVQVQAHYTGGQNVSVTVRKGKVDKVTTWVTGERRSTKRHTF